MITVEDFLYMEDKHKLPDYPDEESVDKVEFFFFKKNKLNINSTLPDSIGPSGWE